MLNHGRHTLSYVNCTIESVGVTDQIIQLTNTLFCPHIWAAIGQVWTRHCRSSRACPTAFITLSVHHMFVRPVAVLVFQTVPGPCLPGWGQSCGPQVLGFTAWAHYSHDTESGSWCVCGVPCLGFALPWLCLHVLAPLGHTPLASCPHTWGGGHPHHRALSATRSWEGAAPVTNLVP